MGNGYNEVNKGYHKYTINLPSQMYEQARVKAEAVGIYSVSIYFRAILIREIKKHLSQDEIISGRRESEITDSANHRRDALDEIDRRKRNILDKISRWCKISN